MKYQVNFTSRNIKGMVYIPGGIPEIEAGFWINADLEFTTGDDCVYFILPHMITKIQKIKEEIDKAREFDANQTYKDGELIVIWNHSHSWHKRRGEVVGIDGERYFVRPIGYIHNLTLDRTEMRKD